MYERNVNQEVPLQFSCGAGGRSFFNMPELKMSSHLADQQNGTLESPRLPPGFRFHPTDEELVSYYLVQKVLSNNFAFQAIGEVDFNKCEPWDLPAKAKMGENMFYFFSLRDRKYPTGMRTNRATEAGYWKATGKDREVMSSSTGKLVGMKKTLVFYTGRAPKGEKTNWIMHEYRLEGESTAPHQQEWVVCRIFEKSAASKKMSNMESNGITSFKTENYTDQTKPCSSLHLPPLQNLEPPSPNSVKPSYMYTGLTLSDSQNYYHGAAPLPGHEPQILLRRSSSNARINAVRRELQLGDSLDNLVSGWDIFSPPDWTWDATDGS